MISEFCSRLNIQKKMKEEAGKLFTVIAKKKDSFKGRSLKGICAAIIYMASKTMKCAITYR